MEKKVIALTGEQMAELEKQLCDIAYNCGMDEDDNAQKVEQEIAIGEFLMIIEYWIMCTSSWYEPATYDYPSDGGCSINIDIRKAYCYVEDENDEVEVQLSKTDFDFDF